MNDILHQVFGNSEAVALVVFCAAAALGQVVHATKKWLQSDVATPLVWFTASGKRTLGAILGNVAGMVVFAQTGVLAPMLTQPNGLWAIFLFGAMNGYSADSGLNRAKRSEWTHEQRTAATKTDEDKLP